MYTQFKKRTREQVREREVCEREREREEREGEIVNYQLKDIIILLSFTCFDSFSFTHL